MYALRLGFGVGWLGVAWSAACGCSAVGLTPGVAATPGVSAAGCCLLFFCFVSLFVGCVLSGSLPAQG